MSCEASSSAWASASLTSGNCLLVTTVRILSPSWTVPRVTQVGNAEAGSAGSFGGSVVGTTCGETAPGAPAGGGEAATGAGSCAVAGGVLGGFKGCGICATASLPNGRGSPRVPFWVPGLRV